MRESSWKKGAGLGRCVLKIRYSKQHFYEGAVSAAVSIIMQQYTEKKGYYNKRELCLLTTSLGFPANLLVDNLRAHFSEGDGRSTVGEKTIAKLLSSGALFKRLEKVFNKYPAAYNVTLIRKAMQHIRHRSLNFADLSESRVAFEVYAYEDGSGIPAELSHVRQALKMLERVMSPSKLKMEIQRSNEVSDVPSRLQMYEFLDIVSLCSRTEVEDEKRLSEVSLAAESEEVVPRESTHELSLPDFSQILMTTDQKVSAHLESKYRDSLHRKQDPPPSSPLDRDHIVHTDSRKSLVSLAAEQSRAVTPCLERSQSQVLRTRNGFYALSNEQYFRSVQNSRQPSPTRLKPSSRRQGAFRADDPLKTGSERRYVQRPVRVRLQHTPQRKALLQSPTREATASKMESERLKTAINDICADSVLRARDTLHSSMSAVSPPHPTHQLPTDMSAVSPPHPTHQLPTDTARASSPICFKLTSEAASRIHTSRSHVRSRLEPIVAESEQETQQDLIDDLQWETLRSRLHYNALK